MCASRAVVQFEVYFLQDGRWTLNSRFGHAERQDAIKDAMHSEGQTGFPTKVIRDTHFPDTNTNETVTIYSSPKLKAQSKHGVRIPPLVKHVRRPVQQNQRLVPTRVNKPPAQPVGEWIADFITRAIVATLLSMLATSLVTGMITWLLTRLADLGFGMQPQTQTALLSFVTIGVFALGFMAFFRVGSRFKNLIRRLWAATSTKSVEETTEDIIRALRYSPKDIKPKYPSRAAAELERQTQEVKRQRGDPDTIVPETTGAPMETHKSATPPSAPVTPPVVAVSEKMHQQSQQPQQPAQQPAAAQQQQQPPQTQQPEPPAQQPAAASAAQPTKPMDLLAARDRAAADQSAAPAPAMEIERALLSRFVSERIMPLLKDQQDDPITRRGLALLLAGAVSHLVVVAQLDFSAQDALLRHGLSQCRLPAAAVEAFLLRRAEAGQGAAGWMLQDAGRAAMAAYLEGDLDLTPLQTAWRAWRLPLKVVTHNEAASQEERPREVYLVTELKGAADPVAMDFHNRLVRAAIEEAGGTEIKHTGRGILSQFDDSTAAIGAAVTVAQSSPVELGPAGGWYAVALVPGFNDADDPLLSPRIGEQAQEFLNTVRQAEIACDRAVLAAATRGLPPGYFAHDENIHYITIRAGAADPAPAAVKGRA